MIFITGDTHGEIDIHKLNRKNFNYDNLTKEDYIIICGDFGFVWYGNRKDNWWLNWLENLPCTILFCDGNHENFDALEKYHIEEWHGGRVQKIRPYVIHLMRGEVYSIENRLFFVMGGAESHDKEDRREGISWWPQEIPKFEDYCRGIENLKKYDYKVDYVVTHCYKIEQYPENNSLISFFRFLEKNTSFHYEHWYFGHYHFDANIDRKHTCLYRTILKLEEDI